MAKLIVNDRVVDESVDPGTPSESIAQLVAENYPSGSNWSVELSEGEKSDLAKKGIQSAIADDFGDGDKNATALSLIGKTSSAFSAALNIHMQVYQNLATAQSLADVRAAIAPALPLMQKVGEKLENGDLLSVQSAQGLNDEDAVIEGLEAMTRAARIIQAQSGQAEAAGSA